jgi:hypothetical protein
MYLAQLFRSNPLVALALMICLATVLCCILVTRRQRYRFDKVLTGLLGLIAISESLRILKDPGFVIFKHFRSLEGWADFISACLFLIAALILKTSNVDHAATKVHVRLMEANEKLLNLPHALIAALPELGHPLVDSSPLAIFAIDLSGIVTYFNRSAEILTGWSRSELVGRRPPFDPRGPIQGKNGDLVECVIWVAPICLPNGPLLGKLITAAGKAMLRDVGLEWPSSPADPTIAVRR